ncbi:MAG TPA: type I-E CRISPR-associated protein Cas5/CasD [Oscillospiraceae bacterium]|nr:type I-E CRISPR-associated protein Cas5/CasD [Oscillospiraceae bacterium]
MSTLLLRLAAPLQSWGDESKFEARKTRREPTKSGIIGILAAALGRKRNESVEDLCLLRFGVRVDREGKLAYDFHTAKPPKAKDPYITTRYYLEDAVFLVGLESEDTELLRTLQDALKHPRFPLFLGRRSCPPTLPLVWGGIRSESLIKALRSEPPIVSKGKRETVEMRIVCDALGNEQRIARQQDLPISFSPEHRKYGYRQVTEFHTQKVEHDPMEELR